MAETETPRLFVEPPIPVTTEFSAVDQVRAVITQLDQGSFRQPALLLERMLWNPRLRSVLETRLSGLIATDVRFKPGKDNRDGRRAVKEFTEDWPAIAASPMRKQMWQYSLFLGFGLGQRVPDVARSGRFIYKLRPYWPGFAQWYWARKAYRIQTFEGVTATASPAFEGEPSADYVPSSFDKVTTPDKSAWVIAEPYGVNSYRNGLIHAAWRPWLGHEWAMRDQARASEKSGIGIIKAHYPSGKGDQHKAALDLYMRGLRTMGSEGIIPCEDRGEGQPGFDAEPFEFNGTGFQAISDTMGANAVALAILLLGHNLTTEIKGGGSYAAAGVADYIRDDKKYEDGAGEWSYVGPQLAEPWAIANYGDPELTPIAEYVTDSPAVNKARAEMINQMAQASAQLKASIPRVDLEQLAEEFRLPMLAEGVAVQVPNTENDTSSASETPPSTDEQPKEEQAA